MRVWKLWPQERESKTFWVRTQPYYNFTLSLLLIFCHFALSEVVAVVAGSVHMWEAWGGGGQPSWLWHSSCVPHYHIMHLVLKSLPAFLGIGRLLRAYNIDFNWYRLAAWINITEQWPYRLSWIIQECEDRPELEDQLTLKNIYDKWVTLISCIFDIAELMVVG